MDLALELGMSTEFLTRTMSEREFRRWALYARRRALPIQRLEFYLAQIAQLIAATMGGDKHAKVSDYLIKLREPEPAAVADDVIVQEAREAFEYNPRKRKG